MAKKVFSPIVKKRARRIPWGYEQDPNDPQLLNPIEEQLVALEKAKRYLRDGCSLRDTAEWLSATTGRYISYVGLRFLIKARRKHDFKQRCATEAQAGDESAGTEAGAEA